MRHRPVCFVRLISSGATEVEAYFRELTDKLCADLLSDEILLLNYQGETTDFVRLNHNKIRQAGQVRQQALRLNLINYGRESSAIMQLSGRLEH